VLDKSVRLEQERTRQRKRKSFKQHQSDTGFESLLKTQDVSNRRAVPKHGSSAQPSLTGDREFFFFSGNHWTTKLCRGKISYNDIAESNF